MKKQTIRGIRTMKKELGQEKSEKILALIQKRASTKSYESVRNWLAQCYNPPTRNERVMCAIDEIMGGYGTESIQGRDNAFDCRFYGDTQIEYVNMGDTYTNTIIFDCEKHEYIYWNWGDFVENNPRRFNQS